MRRPSGSPFSSLIFVTRFRAGFRSGNSIKEDFKMATGTVKWFNDSKGFGFITPDDGGKDLFAHHSEIQMNGFKTLQERQRVEFDVTNGPKGPAASRIRAI